MGTGKTSYRKAVSVLAATLLLPVLAAAASGARAQENAPPGNASRSDVLTFGDPESEAAHNLAADHTAVVTGGVGETARVAQPLDPADIRAGELRFTMQVDPIAQNYFTLKFWGSDVSPYKTIAYVNGEQIGYRRSGDYEAINTGSSRPLVDRFYYNTVMLPLEHTKSQASVEITVRTYDGGFSTPVTGNSRGYYKAYTHTSAYLDVSGEKQGTFQPDTEPTADLTEAQKQALIGGYTASQVNLFNEYSARIDAADNAKLSIVRYQDELRFYAQGLHAGWCPARTEAARRAALQRIFKVIDNHVKDYYGNTRLLLRGGHQGDWGGYYGALGEALYIVENLIADDDVLGQEAFQDFLDEAFVTGAGPNSLDGVDWNGGELSRREAYERVLKANFDFARSRLSYIYNQVMYTYEGAWEAHEGLRVIGSRFYEGKERSHQILLESLGARPFLGEEVLVGPDGGELDLYHSLFYHDTTARFTDDTANIVGKGLARSKLDADGNVVRRLPYGEHYTGITKAGLTRENTYVANYGESTNYLPEHFYRTLGHKGDERLNDEILKLALKNIHARGFTRYTDVDDNRKRIMRGEMVVDERNTSYPGWPGYGLRISEGKILHFASLEKYMADHPERYLGKEWAPYWAYAAEAVGFAQQQLADNQYFNTFSSVADKRKYDHRLAETYAYMTKDRASYERFGKGAAGAVLPQTDFSYYTEEQLAELDVDSADYERFAFVDIDNLFVSLRDGDIRIFGSLFERQRGFAGNGRLHVLNPGYDSIVQVATEGRLRSQDYYARMDNIDVDFMEDQQTRDGTLPQALAGEIAPVAYQPGVGTVRRDNFEVDNPYSGYADFLTTRYGPYLFAFNTTRAEYGNKSPYQLRIPVDYTGSTVLDLVSGRRLPIRGGAITVPAETAVILKLTASSDPAPLPTGVDYVAALPGNDSAVVTWKSAAGAESYTIKRADREGGPYRVVAKGVPGDHYLDRSAANGQTYFYTVTGVNRNGSGRDSYRVRVALGRPVLAHTAWRDDRIGVTQGRASVSGRTIGIAGANGRGLGDGDDYRLDQRDIRDSFHFVDQVLTGSGSVSTKVEPGNGNLNGLMLRDHLAGSGRYIYFGADADGNLVLQNRTRDSRHDWQDDKRSPLNAGLTSYDITRTPHLKLARDTDSHVVQAHASSDGTSWRFVGELFTPLPESIHAGVVADQDATFREVTVWAKPAGVLSPFVVQDLDQITLRWNKPNAATRFDVYRSTNGRAWEQVLDNALTFSYRDENLRSGTRTYKVAAIGPGGVELPRPGILAVRATPLADVIAHVEGLPAQEYTKGSYYELTNAVADVKAKLQEPNRDEAALADLLYDAIKTLVSVDSLLRRVSLDPSMVEASTIIWPGTGTKQENGWRAFDGEIATYTDTLAAESWIDVRLGTGNAVALDGVRFHPRATHLTRANGTLVQGSNDDGATWTNLHTFSRIGEAKWYQVPLTRTAAYERLRIYDNHDGRANLAEVEFLTRTNDTTLLDLLLDKAKAVDQSEYTDESTAALQAASDNGTSVRANDGATQEEIDAATDHLLTALNNLIPK